MFQDKHNDHAASNYNMHGDTRASKNYRYHCATVFVHLHINLNIPRPLKKSCLILTPIFDTACCLWLLASTCSVSRSRILNTLFILRGKLWLEVFFFICKYPIVVIGIAWHYKDGDNINNISWMTLKGNSKSNSKR